MRHPELAEFCEQRLGSTPSRVLFERGHLAHVVGVELADGRRVVVKVRPAAARIAGCVAVQSHLFTAGFPCPEPLAGPSRLGSADATAEAYVPGGQSLIHNAPAPALFARLLAKLVELAPPVDSVPSLEPAPPWVGWAHEGTGTWPHPDDLVLDLNQHPGPAWIDTIGGLLRDRLTASQSTAIVGHADWESHNIRWSGYRPFSVDDWDSVAALSEQAIAGAAAAVFPSTPDGRTVAATVEQTAGFLHAYQVARGIEWSADELEICWAAGLWVLAYNAKKEAWGGGKGYLEHLQHESAERMDQAGIG